MYHWFTSLGIEHYVMLSELVEARNIKADKLAIHLLEREHARVFGPRAPIPGDPDDDEPTNPGTPAGKAKRR